MKYLTAILLVLSGMSALAAVWAPGRWWQWLLTSGIMLVAAAGCAEGEK